MRQELLFITGRQRGHDVPERPDELWLLIHGRHRVPLALVHRRDGFLEDQGHDWHWSNGQLFYHGAGDPPCWVVLVYGRER